MNTRVMKVRRFKSIQLLAFLLGSLTLVAGLTAVASDEAKERMTAQEKIEMEKARSRAEQEMSVRDGAARLSDLSSVVHAWHVARNQRDLEAKRKQESVIRLVVEAEQRSLAPYAKRAAAEVHRYYEEQEKAKMVDDTALPQLKYLKPQDSTVKDKKIDVKIVDDLRDEKAERKQDKMEDHERMLFYQVVLEKQEIADKLLAADAETMDDADRAELYDKYVALSRREAELKRFKDPVPLPKKGQ